MRRFGLLLVPIAAFVGLTGIATPATECRLPDVVPRRLNLSDSANRRELADELRQIDAIAARYREVIRAAPRESDSVDAKRTYATRPDRAYQYCQAVLREQLAGAYGITPAELAASSPR